MIKKRTLQGVKHLETAALVRKVRYFGIMFLSFFIVSGLHKRNVRVETNKIFAGCKESQFYSLPFGQAAANMY